MIHLYPAIDLYDGTVVRLEQGDYNKKKVYSGSPEEIASRWESQGAGRLHVIDLEGAKEGSIKNKEALVHIRKAVRCFIQFGGGVRTLDDIQSALDAGADRVILGTRLLEAKFLESALNHFPKKIAASLDVYDGQLRTEGWLVHKGKSAVSALSFLNDFPLETVIFTDIRKDGMLRGPNLSDLSQVLDSTRANVILSGGIASLQDIERCVQIHHPRFEGVIVGKALYENRIDLNEALVCIRRHPSK